MTKKKKKTKKTKYKLVPITIILVLFVFFFGYIILETDYLQPGIDELTASYISFNNAKPTDILKIPNIKKMNDNKGKTKYNDNNISFEVIGDKDKSFEILLYSVGNNIDESNIKFYLENKNDSKEGKLIDFETDIDNGKIIYKGKLTNNNKYKLYVWIDNNYKGSTKNISYEIRIKSR